MCPKKNWCKGNYKYCENVEKNGKAADREDTTGETPIYRFSLLMLC